MASAKTGFWSAIGAVLGGAAGAYAGQFAAKARPRVRYFKSRGGDIEDAMVIGGATGAVVGAFIGGAVSSEDTPPQLSK